MKKLVLLLCFLSAAACQNDNKQNAISTTPMFPASCQQYPGAYGGGGPCTVYNPSQYAGNLGCPAGYVPVQTAPTVYSPNGMTCMYSTMISGFAQGNTGFNGNGIIQSCDSYQGNISCGSAGNLRCMVSGGQRWGFCAP